MNKQDISLEALATAAQRGNKEVMPLLWEKTQRLIKMLIMRMLSRRKLPNHIDTEDVLQCGYFVLLAAVRGFKQGEYKFTAYLNYSVQNVVNECINGRSRRPDKFRTVSYNKTIGDDSGDNDIELLELLTDEQAEYDVFEPVELDDMQRIVQAAVSELPPNQQNVIKQHFFFKRTYTEIAQRQGCSTSYIITTARNAFRTLRCMPELKNLYSEIRGNRFIKGFSYFRCSPEYYDYVDKARQLERDLSQSGFLSYGQRQAKKALLLHQAEQNYKQRCPNEDSI